MQKTRAAALRAADLLRSSRYAVALTGAGISTPSGIPDFRSPGSGLWERFDPMEVASLSAFRRNPRRFFAWARPLASSIQAARPNSAHLALVRLEKCGLLKAVITQNIDGLHRRAGSKTVLEVHGSLDTLTCTRCGRQMDAAPCLNDFLNSGVIPRCPACGAVAKPDIVLFGEMLPLEVWQRAMGHIQNCDLVLVAGTSLEVAPVSDLPLLAIDHGAHLLIFNREPSGLDARADVILRGDLVETLPLVADLTFGDRT
jgi:NAD-dependent deacetylase